MSPNGTLQNGARDRSGVQEIKSAADVNAVRHRVADFLTRFRQRDAFCRNETQSQC